MSLKHELCMFLYKQKFSKNKVQNKQKMYKMLNELGFNIAFSPDSSHVYVKNDVFDFKFPIDADIPMVGAFVHRDYKFSINKPYVMFDIGMNMATTSILFAQDKNIKKVYGFEPFPVTFNIALENIKRNQNADKIVSYNFGLSDRNETKEFAYNIKRSICMSTRVEGSTIECKDKYAVELRNASEVLGPLFYEQTERIFVKIDCEGAEWEIIPDLAQNGLLEKIDVLIMEYHFQPPDKLIEHLTKAGFLVFDYRERVYKTGILRAVRTI